MVITDKIVFLELQKSGCTHTRSILKGEFGGIFLGKHNGIYEIDDPIAAGITDDKIIVGGVRNPWEWYVSLWAYGANNKGTLFKTLTTFSIRNILKYGFIYYPKWKKYYKDYNDPELFRAWLKAICSNDHINKMGEGFAQSPIAQKGGFMTYRFFKIFGKDKNVMTEDLNLDDLYKKYIVVDEIIRNETLATDLLRILGKVGHNVEGKEEKLKGKKRTNTSKRKSIMEYYDEETIRLVAQKEHFIIDKFNYKAPTF